LWTLYIYKQYISGTSKYEIFSVTGRLIKSVFFSAAGQHSGYRINLSKIDITPGVYYLRVHTGNYNLKKKIVLSK